MLGRCWSTSDCEKEELTFRVRVEEGHHVQAIDSMLDEHEFQALWEY